MAVNTTLTGLAAIFSSVLIKLPLEQAKTMEELAVIIETEAKRVLGTYDYGWPSLAASTLARKSADTPGIETGEMRDSIQHFSNRDELEVGSDNDKALWFELGTSRGQPPRSFLGQAVRHKEAEIRAVFGNMLSRVFPH